MFVKIVTLFTIVTIVSGQSGGFALNTFNNMGRNAMKELVAPMDRFSDRLTTTLTKSTQTAKGSVSELIKLISDISKNITEQLQSSEHEAAIAIISSAKEMGDSIVSLGEQLKVNIESGDLEKAGETASLNLQKALADLSEKWSIALDSKHFSGFGEAAGKQLKEGLQNMKMNTRVTVNFEMDEGIVVIGKFVAISTVFLLFVAIVAFSKDCREKFFHIPHFHHHIEHDLEKGESEQDKPIISEPHFPVRIGVIIDSGSNGFEKCRPFGQKQFYAIKPVIKV